MNYKNLILGILLYFISNLAFSQTEGTNTNSDKIDKKRSYFKIKNNRLIQKYIKYKKNRQYLQNASLYENTEFKPIFNIYNALLSEKLYFDKIKPDSKRETKKKYIKSLNIFDEIYSDVEKKINKDVIKSDKDILNLFDLINESIENKGIRKRGDGIFAIENLSSEFPSVNCYLSSLLEISILQKMNFPVYPVYSLNHEFIAWVKEDGSKIYYDVIYEKSYPLSEYSKMAKRNLNSDFFLDTLSLYKASAIFFYNQAFDLFKKNDIEKSKKYNDKALEIDNKMYNVRLNEALICSRLGRVQEAIDLYEKIKKEDSTTVKARYFQAKQYRLLGKFEKAEKDLLDVIKIQQHFYSAYLLLGKIYCDKGDFEKAEKVLIQLKGFGEMQTQLKTYSLKSYIQSSQNK